MSNKIFLVLEKQDTGNHSDFGNSTILSCYRKCKIPQFLNDVWLISPFLQYKTLVTYMYAIQNKFFLFLIHIRFYCFKANVNIYLYIYVYAWNFLFKIFLPSTYIHIARNYMLWFIICMVN